MALLNYRNELFREQFPEKHIILGAGPAFLCPYRKPKTGEGTPHRPTIVPMSNFFFA
jgi:hypothetical protein